MAPPLQWQFGAGTAVDEDILADAINQQSAGRSRTGTREIGPVAAGMTGRRREVRLSSVRTGCYRTRPWTEKELLELVGK
jgi:hypothetical protein